MKSKLLTANEYNRFKLAYEAKTDKLVRITRGVYSSNRFYDMLEVYSLRYPNAIFTLETLFSLYEMTDQFIDKYWIVTQRGSRTINDERIVQMRQLDDIIYIGKTSILHGDTQITVYDKERLLIELFRFSNRISKTMYQEVIKYYRNNVYHNFDFNKFHDYCTYFKNNGLLKAKFTKEIL